MASLLYRIGDFAARRGWIVVIAWLLIIAAISTLSGALGAKEQASFSIPGTQSQDALDMLNQRFPQVGGASVNVIFVAPAGKDISTFEPQIESAVTALGSVANVTGVTDPFASGQSAHIATDGSMAYATVQLNMPTADITDAVLTTIETAAEKAQQGGVTLAYTGLPDIVGSPSFASEGIGLTISLIVLLITFGSLIAAGMPLITAGLGVTLSSSLIVLLSHVVTLNTTTPLLAEMIGLAVGIDYALFIVSRHRNNLATGMDPKQSIAVSTATAGSAVVFAGMTVIIALLGLFVVGIPFLGMMGLGAAIAVAMAILIAVTLVPAILGLFGKHLTPRAQSRAWQRAQPEHTNTMGARWVKLVTAKPIVTIIIVLAGVILLALPTASLKLALPDAGSNPVGTVSRTGYDTMVKGFGPGANGALMVVADISKTDLSNIESTLSELHDAFTGNSDIQSVTQAIPNAQLDTAIVIVTPKSSPDSDATAQLVSELRANAAGFEKKNGFTYEITGQTAMGIDISTTLMGAIIPFALIVVGLSIVLLMIVFRSIAVPITATLGFILSVFGAFGVTTAVFVWGWGADLLGVTKVGPVISFMPILVMAVLFGLAMDYEVFLVSRMRERFVSTKDAHGAVREGFRASARVVTAASLIMTSVFVAFIPGGTVIMQSIALALAVGVALDALVVRMTLIPALMTLLGDKAWALPKRLSRKLPDVDIEGERVHGRLATLKWSQNNNPDVVIAAEDVNVLGSGLDRFSLTAYTGDVVLMHATRSVDLDLALAALTGRAEALGLLVAAGRPLPYDAPFVRKQASLVLYRSTVMEGSATDYIRETLRLNRLKAGSHEVDAARDLAAELAVRAEVDLGSLGPDRDTETLSTSQVWLIDLAVALLSQPRILACDVRQVTHEADGLISLITEKMPAESVLILGVSDKLEPTIVGRRVETLRITPRKHKRSTGKNSTPARASQAVSA